MPGRLERIWIKRFHRGPMQEVTRAQLQAGKGIVENAHQGGKRQVTIISLERWARLSTALGVPIDPVSRRANLLVSGVDLTESRGRVLVVGSCRLAVRGETRPCAQMDEALPGLRQAMSQPWAGGAFAEVLDAGVIHVGDEVQWEH